MPNQTRYFAIVGNGQFDDVSGNYRGLTLRGQARTGGSRTGILTTTADGSGRDRSGAPVACSERHRNTQSLGPGLNLSEQKGNRMGIARRFDNTDDGRMLYNEATTSTVTPHQATPRPFRSGQFARDKGNRGQMAIGYTQLLHDVTADLILEVTEPSNGSQQ